VVQAEGKPHLPQVSIVKTLVVALACHTTHFVVQIGPFLLLASAIEDEADDFGIEFHAEQNYSLATGQKQSGWRQLSRFAWLGGHVLGDRFAGFSSHFFMASTWEGNHWPYLWTT
jgi:hypothetical protein